MRFRDLILITYVFIMYIVCLIIFEEKAEVQDHYPLSLNPVQKADDLIQDRNWSIGPIFWGYVAKILKSKEIADDILISFNFRNYVL